MLVSTIPWPEPVKQVEHLSSTGCQIFYRRPPALSSRIARKILRRTSYIDEHVRCLTRGVDLVLISYSAYFQALPWIDAVRIANVPYAIVVQGASEMPWPTDEEAEKLALGFENAACAYFVSEANRKLFRRQLGVPLQKSRVIRNPFRVRYDARVPWPELPPDRLSLACVARLDVAQKGQDLLIEVLALPHWRRRDIHVALVGDGPNERSVRRMVQMEELSKIEVAGYVDDIEGLWAKHHALVLPSRFEGMPIALVEAMLCGRAAIVTDVAGHRDLVHDGVNGFLAKAPTVEFIDEAMNRAWENRGRLREMGEAAAADVRKWVSADPVAEFVRDLTVLVGNSHPA